METESEQKLSFQEAIRDLNHEKNPWVKSHMIKYLEENEPDIYQMYLDHKRNKVNERSKIYNQINKDKIKEKHTEKFSCECGGRYTYAKKSHHFKSKKHIKFIDTVNKTS